MSLSFTRAIESVPGQPITSDQMASLSRAWNDRIMSGVGDIAWRTVVWWLNLFRLMRYPDGSFFPAMHEFFNLYQHLDPEHIDGQQWPTAGPDDPEGANTANPLMQFVFGSSAVDVDSEHIRLQDFTEAPETLEGHWELAKAQRGAYDPDSGALSCPAFTKAQSIYAFAFPSFSPYHKSYGAWFPTPTELLADCAAGDTGSEYYLTPSYAIKFTRLSSDVSATGLHGTLVGDVLTYAGTCPCAAPVPVADPDTYYVQWVAEYPFAYYVWVARATDACAYLIDVLPVSDWIEGPYTGDPHIWRPDGGQIKRVIAAYVQDFRGTPEQRKQHDLIGQHGAQAIGSDTYKIKQLAVDNEALMTCQYPLAPSFGIELGESVEAVYIRATLTSEKRQGTTIPFDSASTTHQIHAGFVCAGWFIKAIGLADPCTVGLYSDGVLVWTLTLTPDSTGAAEALAYLVSNPPTGLVSLKALTGIRFQGSGQLSIEAAEVLSYKPAFHDAYLVTRLMSTHGSLDTTAAVDGRGIDQSDSKDYVSRFHRYGTIHNSLGGLSIRMPENAVNDNGVYDAARRFSRDMVRIWRREHFVSYEVAGGKSILRMKRFAFGLHNIRADAFHNIAPPLDPIQSGSLEVGVVYIVRGLAGSQIHHGGTAYVPDATFTASATDFTETGGAAVYVYDGIRQTARRNNWSNRWCLFLDTKVYHPSSSSIWKPDAYTDFFPLINRCLFYAGNCPSAEFRRHIGFGYGSSLDSDDLPFLLPPSVQTSLLAAEAPSGYRYSKLANQAGGEPTADFCKSCQIYVAPYEVESCIVESAWDGDQVLKITLDRRLDSHADAPATVNPDVSTWTADEKTALAAESYRTDDNALRQYALHLYDGTNSAHKTGDAGTDSAVWGLADNPYGAYYPTFCAVHLMPEPWVDANNVVDPLDTRCTVPAMMQAEVLTRAGCEGFVDGQTSIDLQCAGTDSLLFDYSFKALCFKAFGGVWCSAFTTAERSDNPEGFGPMVNTKRRAEVYNHLVQCVNLLTKARIDFPLSFEVRDTTYAQQSHTALNMQGQACSTTGTMGAFSEPCRWLGAGAPTVGAWSVTNSSQASKSMFLDGCPFTLECNQVDSEYKVTVDPTLAYALPTDLAELVDLGAAGCMARRTITTADFHREAVAIGDADLCNGTAVWFFDGVYYRWTQRGSATEDCVLVTSGTITAPTPAEQSISIGRLAGDTPDTYCQLNPVTYYILEIAASTEFFVEVPLVDYTR